MGELDDFYVLAFAVPTVLALGTAYGMARLLRSRLESVVSPVRFVVAATAPMAVIFGYFIIWDAIELARHRAEYGDMGYMGPLGMLVYGFPIYVALVVACILVAAFTFHSRK
ncbi:hypothetical protein [Alteriqipengyuania sp.]|uniref:hypothetical protein n=1 Tax=Alteriqipengyuania sp. TaxID=2800692 RepID=UPI0035180262